MGMPSENARKQGNLIRLGTIAELDLGAALCRVRTGELTTDWIPWLAPRTGTTMEWSAPSIGEQGVVFCQGGDTTGAVFLRGLYSDANPAPSQADGVHMTRYVDGAVVQYDSLAHALMAALPTGGTATITADGGVTINGPLTINGDVTVAGDANVSKTLTASTDVIGGGKSLKSHTHGGVQSGSSSTGKPQ